MAPDGRVRAGDLVVFSSGSTGRPRGIVRPVASWEASVADAAAAFDLRPGDAVGLGGPLASTIYLFAAWHAARVGARPVDAGLDHRDITHAHVVPARVPALLADVAAGRRPRLRCVVVGGDTLAPDLARRVLRAGCRLVTYYGAAELSFIGLRVLDPTDGEGETDASGAPAWAAPLRPFPGVEVEVRDGVLWSRSGHTSRGYLDPADPGPWRRDADGWSSVGDLGRRRDGGFDVLGRGAAAVATGGHTVVAEDVEARLRAVPGVVDAVVVGLPHARLGQRLVAVVESDGAAPPAAAEDVVAALRAAVASWPAPSRPRGWVVAPVPRTDAGKVDRVRARDAALAALGPTGRDTADASPPHPDRADPDRVDVERARADRRDLDHADADRAHSDRADLGRAHPDRADPDRASADRRDLDHPDRAHPDRADAAEASTLRRPPKESP